MTGTCAGSAMARAIRSNRNAYEEDKDNEEEEGEDEGDNDEDEDEDDEGSPVTGRASAVEANLEQPWNNPPKDQLYSILDSICPHVHEVFACIGVYGSTQGSNVVKHNLEEKPIQIPRRPDLSRGHLEANKEKPNQMLRPILSSLNLEDKEGKKEEGQSSLQLESKEDARDSYDEDECKRFALSHQNELLSSEQNNNSCQNEDSSDGDSISHGKANGLDSLPQGKAISKKQNAQRMLYKQKKKSKQDGEKDEAPISLDFEDSKGLSMQDLDSTEVEKEANIGGEEETRLHEQQEWIRGDLIVAGCTPNKALKALNTCAKVQEHEEATSVKPTTKTTIQELTSVELGTSNTLVWEATSVKPTTKTTVQELTFVELDTSNTTVWEATSIKPTTKTTVQEHGVTATATSAEVTAKLEHKATTVKEHKATSSSSIAEEHNAATIEVANIDKLEEATPDIDGDNLKLFSFILGGFKMRKSYSRPTHNGSNLVHLPKTTSGSK
ncbi:hypothetical protein L7F22_066898 [Adiantum nelumboides]|nr:hypothetical protein [Adiantum nelumboides]